MRVMILTAAILSVASFPAQAGEIGAGGCNFGKMQINAELPKIKQVPVAAVQVIDPTLLIPQINQERLAEMLPANTKVQLPL